MSINTRDKLVRDLNATEAGRLLVHGHTITKERRDALLFRRGPIEAYFSAEEAKAIRQWIETEDYLPQDYRIDGSLDCHPKRPTHWCDKHGHVVACDCDKRRSKRDERASEDWQALKDLLDAYHGLTLGRQDTEWEGQIKVKARAALEKLKLKAGI